MAFRVAIVGAGLAGLTCAQALRQAGADVIVFEKSRGPSGRMATRRTDAAQFDHGAQYFTVRDPRFAQFIDAQLESGAVAQWSPRMTQTVPEPWYVGTPGMSALGRAQASGLELKCQARVVGLERASGACLWRLSCEDGQVFEGFDAVVVATPNEQAIDLLPDTVASWQQQLREVPMLPCWTLMFSTDQPLVDLDAAAPEASPIGWWARNSSKPARPVVKGRHDWVLQARADWTFAHLDDDKPNVANALLSAWAELLSLPSVEPLAPPIVHRWLYARRTPDLSPIAPALWNAELGLGVCGDGLTHSRVEHAYLSGAILAERITESIKS